jgi:hypothetical protein
MSAPMCGCLAAWVDTEPCICDEPIGAPMEVSAKKIAEADRLVRKVREIDHALGNITKNKPYCRTLVWYGNDNRVEVVLPFDLAHGLLQTMRFQTLVELSKTGVTSMASGYRPVVSA